MCVAHKLQRRELRQWETRAAPRLRWKRRKIVKLTANNEETINHIWEWFAFMISRVAPSVPCTPVTRSKHINKSSRSVLKGLSLGKQRRWSWWSVEVRPLEIISTKFSALDLWSALVRDKSKRRCGPGEKIENWSIISSTSDYRHLETLPIMTIWPILSQSGEKSLLKALRINHCEEIFARVIEARGQRR